VSKNIVSTTLTSNLNIMILEKAGLLSQHPYGRIMSIVMQLLVVFGILLSPATIRALNSIKEIEPKILIANFNGYSTKTIISCYSPTNVSDIEDVENLKESLSSLVRLAPSIIFK